MSSGKELIIKYNNVESDVFDVFYVRNWSTIYRGKTCHEIWHERWNAGRALPGRIRHKRKFEPTESYQPVMFTSEEVIL